MVTIAPYAVNNWDTYPASPLDPTKMMRLEQAVRDASVLLGTMTGTGGTDIAAMISAGVTSGINALPAVARSGSYADLSSKPSVVNTYNGQSGTVTSAKRDVYVDGVAIGDDCILIANTTVQSGVATWAATKLVNGVAVPIFDSILPDSAEYDCQDVTGVYVFGPPTLAVDKKSISATVRKQQMNVVTVVAVSVLASLSLVAPPNGQAAKLHIIGVPA